MQVSGFNANSSVTNNTIADIYGQNLVTGLAVGGSGSPALLTVSGNTIRQLVSSGVGNNVAGLTLGHDAAVVNVSQNAIDNLSSTGAASSVIGLRITSGAGTINADRNTIHSLSGSGSGFSVSQGIQVSGGNNVNLFKNSIANLLQSGVNGVVTGISVTGGISVSAYNNLVGDLRAPVASASFPVRGIGVTPPGTSSTRLYFNSVYLDAVSSGAVFGSAGIYHTANATAGAASLLMNNNVVVNLSQANGTGRTVALYRTGTTLVNYTAGSNNNLFYAGAPSASNLVYSDGTNADQTLATFQARVTPRESASRWGNPQFISTSWGSPVFLRPDFSHAATATLLDNRGVAVASVPDDYLGAVRAAVPDLGAYENNCSYQATLSPVGPLAFCDGSSQWLTVTTDAPAPTYVWKRDGLVLTQVTDSLMVDVPGIYEVTVTDGLTQCQITTNAVPVMFETAVWAGSWSLPPTASRAVIFEADYTATDTLYACSITVTNGSEVYFPAGTNAIVDGAVMVNSGTFTLADNANLIQSQDVQNTGEISVVKNTAPIYRFDYTLWSSPVENQNLKEFSPMTLSNRFYTYVPATDVYAVIDPETNEFGAGRGYLIRVSNNHPSFVNEGTPGVSWTGTFTGVPHNGTFNVPVSLAGNGYNAIGNPYPSPINVWDFIDANEPALADQTCIQRQQRAGRGRGRLSI